MKERAAIKAIATHLPARKLTNEQLAEEFGKDWDADKILKKTGISVRSIAAAEECSSDLGVAAANRLFGSGVCSPSEIDFLLFCTQSPDYFLPTTACTMQARLGLRTDCGALDFNQGWSGFVYGLSLAKGLVETGAASNVLLITAETYSKFINPKDRSTRTIFSDGAAATLIGPVETESEMVGPFVFGTDGKGAREVIVPMGGMRQRFAPEGMIEREDGNGNWRSECDMYMNGPEIFNFVLRAVPRTLAELLNRSGRCLEQIDFFIFHQANKFMLEALRNKLKIPAHKFWIDLQICGNTVSSTIPIAIESAKREGLIRAGDHVAVFGFGVGLSWAAAMIQII